MRRYFARFFSRVVIDESADRAILLTALQMFINSLREFVDFEPKFFQARPNPRPTLHTTYVPAIGTTKHAAVGVHGRKEQERGDAQASPPLVPLAVTTV